MCLIVQTKNRQDSINNYIKIAEKDITVYKILEHDIFNNRYYTPYQGYPISPNGDIITTNSFGIKRYERYIEIHRGIHSYTNLEFARKKLSIFVRTILMECIIPKDTPYIESNEMFEKINEIVSLILIIPPIDRKSLCKK